MNSNSVIKVFDYTAVLNDGIYNEDEMNATVATANITIQNKTFNGFQKNLVINGDTLADSITPVSGSVYRFKNVKNDFFLRGDIPTKKMTDAGSFCELKLYENASHPIFYYRKGVSNYYYKILKDSELFLKKHSFL
ncbi:hypothetical protein MKD41_14905 [Lutibacter sp. A64]|uniref:hypothetical protein n=1 Tax=Lutibacter sp. A64 TaxID=2918526 RepID=UPI001F06DC6B|nr:hypothetical protein [Lutibacter sp. A64]UMB53611.1 hypothetical protein MKD41_14905 [Lutibacter sp. A64]